MPNSCPGSTSSHLQSLPKVVMSGIFPPSTRERPPESSGLGDTVKDARVGDVFTVSDLSIEYEESYFIIEKLNRYESSVGRWYEVLGADGDKKLWLQWSDDGGLHVSAMADGRPMGLSRLGLVEAQLVKMDDDQSIDNSFTYEDTRFHYQFSGEAQYYQDDRGSGEGFYLWAPRRGRRSSPHTAPTRASRAACGKANRHRQRSAREYGCDGPCRLLCGGRARLPRPNRREFPRSGLQS